MKNIKKTGVILIVLLLFATFCSCNGAKESQNTSSAAATSDILDTPGEKVLISDALPDYDIEITYDTPQKIHPLSLSVIDKNKKNEIQKIVVSECERFTKKPLYFYDVNFDGNADILLPCQKTAASAYYKAYIWDDLVGILQESPTFCLIDNPAADTQNKCILSEHSGDKTTNYSVYIFDEDIMDFKVAKTLCYYYQNGNIEGREEILRDNLLQQADSFRYPLGEDEDYYDLCEQIKKKYDKSDWQLNSEKWKKYIVPSSEING